MRRRQARRANGRFTRNTLQNTFGLRVEVCSKGHLTPYKLDESPPTICVQCGEQFSHD